MYSKLLNGVADEQSAPCLKCLERSSCERLLNCPSLLKGTPRCLLASPRSSQTPVLALIVGSAWTAKEADAGRPTGLWDEALLTGEVISGSRCLTVVLDGESGWPQWVAEGGR